MIVDLLTSEIETSDYRLLKRLVLLNIFLHASIVIFVGFALFNYILRDYVITYLNLAGAILSTLFLFDLRYKKNIQRVRYVVVAEFFIFFITFVYFNQNSSFGLIWSQLFPIIAIGLLGVQKGTVISLIYLSIIFVLAYINIGIWNYGLWDSISFFRLVFASISISTIIVSMEIALEKSYQRLEFLSATDSLTSLYNRRKINEILKAEVNKANRYKTELSLILFDIDDFKKVNDNYGHETGDNVLKVLAKNVQKQLRDSDSIARWGGEEFIIVTPMTRKIEAVMLAEKLRASIEAIECNTISGFTCSFGVASLWECDNNIEQLINRADNAMYTAKTNGKNCVSDT